MWLGPFVCFAPAFRLGVAQEQGGACALRIFGSILFAALVALATVATFRHGGLVASVKDGKPAFFKHSTGSMAGTDEYLLFVWLLVPSAVLRLIRASARPAIVEIPWFCFAVWIVYIGFSSVGRDTFQDTWDTTRDIWIATELAATAVAVLVFLALMAQGWLRRS
jgi:hypothetical protein